MLMRHASCLAAVGTLLAGCALERTPVPFEALAVCDIVECEGTWSWEATDRRHGSSSTGGGVSQTAGHSDHAAVIRGAEGHPIVAWEEGSEIHIVAWDGNAWAPLGPPAAGSRPALALLAGTTPVRAFQRRPENWEIRVERWTGEIWTAVGTNQVLATTLYGDGLEPLPDLASGAGGELFVAWSSYDSVTVQIHLLSWNGSAWVELDGSATGGGVSQSSPNSGYRPSVAVDSSGQPVVAWEEYSNGSVAEIFLRAWETDAWVAVSGSTDPQAISGTDNALAPSVVVDASGPVVAWQSAAGDISVARENGTVWERLGGGPLSTGATPSLGLTEAGAVMVAWSDLPEVDGVKQIFAASWNGSDWVGLGNTTAQLTDDLGHSQWPALAAPGGVAPLLAWHDASTTLDPTPYGSPAEIFVEELTTAGTWQPFGTETLMALTESGEAAAAVAPTLAMTDAGGMVLAWHRESLDGSSSVHVMRHDGSVWSPLGATSQVTPSDDSTNQFPCLAPDGNTPTLAWVHGDGARFDIYVARWDGSAWQPMNGSTSGTGITGEQRGEADQPAVALVGGEPVVAWQDADAGGATQIFLKRWTGSTWEGLDGSASGHGISDAADSFAPAVAASTDSVVVAWTRDTGSGSFEIYLRRWHDGRWGALNDSASGMGISRTPASNSLYPAAALVGEDPVVAWTEQNDAGRFTFVRRWDDGSSNWVELNNSGSGTGIGGVTLNDAPASVGVHVPAIAVDGRGRIWVAWADASTGIYEIYARRWNGSSWESVDGSAEGGGVSDTSAASLQPALAATDGRACVAWSQGIRRTMEIATRCATPE